MVLIVVIVFETTPAEAAPKNSGADLTIGQFFIMEGLAAFNSGLAASEPGGFGVLLILISPMAFITKAENPYTGFTFFLALGGYNIWRGESLRDSTLTEKDKRSIQISIFLENMAAWNLLWFLDSAKKSVSGNSSFTPFFLVTRDGFRDAMVYRF